MSQLGVKRFADNVSQRQDELERFIELLIQEQVQSYLEIGLRFGATFLAVGERLPKGSSLVGIDLPGASGGVRHPLIASAMMEVERSARALRQRGHMVDICWGDSRSSGAVAHARKFAPYDAVLIDGDHSPEGVRADWVNYSPMTRIVAFHDIAVIAPGKSKRYGVAALWAELKPRFRHLEILGANPGMGIGVIWM